MQTKYKLENFKAQRAIKFLNEQKLTNTVQTRVLPVSISKFTRRIGRRPPFPNQQRRKIHLPLVHTSSLLYLTSYHLVSQIYKEFHFVRAQKLENSFPIKTKNTQNTKLTCWYKEMNF